MEQLEPRLALDGAPDAPTWLVAPYASGDTSSYSVTMAILPVSGLEYYFHNTTITDHDSGWQSDVTYVDQGLSANTSYTYEVKARVIDETAESDYSDTASATTFTATVAAVMRVANEIRAIETFSNPNNPGQIYQALVKDGFPNPDAANQASQVSATDGMAAYPGDLRNTPSAFQVDLANMGVYDSTNPAKEQFGIWHQEMAAAKNSGLYDTQFAFSQSTLQDFFGITVNDEGLIKEIGAAAASVFLHDDGLAYSTTWDSTDNALIDLHIDAFRSEQLSLYLAGREAADARIGVTDPRTSPPNVMQLSAALQYQVAKSYMYAVIQKYKVHETYKPTYDNISKLFGAEMDITSSQKAFGVQIGDVFKCRLNDLFLLGGAYVSGEVEVFNLMNAIWSAYENGTATWAATGGNIGITRVSAAGQLSGAKFSFDGTPQNVGPEYPSVLHYSAVMSALPTVDFDDKASWGIVDGTSRRIQSDNDLGYTRLSPTAVETITTTQELTTGGLYSYTTLQAGQTLTLSGSDDFMIITTPACVVRADGYNNPSNCNQMVPVGRSIDVSDFFAENLLTTNQQLYDSSFYVWYDSEGTQVCRVYDPTFDFDKVPWSLSLYIAPEAQDQAGFDEMVAAIQAWTFGAPGSKFEYSARVSLASKEMLGKPTSADQWAQNFITYSTGTGVIDASQTTGNVYVVADKTINKVMLGTGKTTLLTSGSDSLQKTYVLNASATTTPTVELRSGDVFELSSGIQGLTWTYDTGATYDNKATNYPYLPYSYYAGWTGKDAASATKCSFQAIVRTLENTGATNDPVEIINNALNPPKVTINRATAQTAQTSASQLSYTVVFSEAMDDFNANDVTLSGPAATLTGATVSVANPSGDDMTYTVTVTLKDTATTGNITGTIGGGEVHDPDGFTNRPSTSTSNTVAYVPNTISGQETSGSEPLPGILITLTSSTVGFATRTTTTDTDGNYQFIVPDGAYQVTMTPPNACLNSGAVTTAVTAASSQTYETDFTVGALKPAYIPNRMMVTSSLPVGSTRWQAVVQEALNLGDQAGSQGAQYLTLAPQAATVASVAPTVYGAVVATQNIARPQTYQEPAPITKVTIAPIVQEAIMRWEAAGTDQAALDTMRNTTFVLSDLPALYLGMTRGTTVWLDLDAAGRGWFADLTPTDNEEFVTSASGSMMQAVDPQAVDRIDLLTVVSHELGHIAGLEDSELSDLMGPLLEPGLRFVASAHDAALASI